MILVYFLVFVGVVYTLFLYYTRPPAGSPPIARGGFPLLGHVLEFVRSPLGMIQDKLNSDGRVFTAMMGPQRMTFLIGPEEQTAFFSAKDDTLSQPEVYGFMKPVFGPNVVYDAPVDRRTQQMRHLAYGLRSNRLESYVLKIQKETEFFISSWGEKGEFDLLDTLSDLTILTASRCLHGDDVRENMISKVSELYHDLDQGITTISFFFPNAPIPAHFRRNRARLEMVELFSKAMDIRREKIKSNPESKESYTDLLQVLMDLEYRDGTRPTDEEITGLLIALLFAGQHTSSITSTWTTSFIFRDRNLVQRLIEEQKTVLGDKKDLTFEDINKMDLLHACIQEALRMYPPLIMLMRKAKQNFPVTTSDGKTYTVPAGDIVVSSPAVAHRLPDVYTCPDVFDPDRFLPPREEHKKAKFAYLGFGGGLHACMGQQFGFLQIKTILSILLRSYDFEPIGNLPKPNYAAMVVGPHSPVPIRYYKK